jgi:hypothetical protein
MLQLTMLHMFNDCGSSFAACLRSVFHRFKIEEEFQSYSQALEQAVLDCMPVLGCET